MSAAIAITRMDHGLDELRQRAKRVLDKAQARRLLAIAMVLVVAINGRADMLVTRNIVDFRISEERFGIAVLTPGQAMARIRT